MAKVEYSPAALDDLRQIHHYILSNWGESVAERVLKKITTDIKNLEQFPVLGVALGELIDIPTDYRYLFSEKNYIFYRLELDKVKIVRILNEYQEYMEHLFNETSESNDLTDDK